ncbi:MAG: ABC transporter permease [Planctomycetales bacterium]|nr:ABC transporter permease [Planctomycetales bacterium]
MYKLLLSLRYLRSRYIALASIVSVMLGVATMVVVNSVMSGFQSEMYKRLHGILSDIIVEAHSADGMEDHEIVQAEIKQILGDDLEGITTTVHVPAIISMNVRGQWQRKQINLIGVDEKTYGDVGDFSQYLLHPENRKQLRFDLREKGFDERIGDAGWPYRRMKASIERMQRHLEEAESEAPQDQFVHDAQVAAGDDQPMLREDLDDDLAVNIEAEQVDTETADFEITHEPEIPADEIAAGEEVEDSIDFDPGEESPFITQEANEVQQFDATESTWDGIVLGMAISNIRHRKPDGEVADFFMSKPGDDVIVTFASAGAKPQAINANFTVVDFYESKMSEYDSTFAFVPIETLQRHRGMIDPASGATAVSSIQIKLRDGASLEECCEKLRKRYPPQLFPYSIQTWKEMQGPLLAAVQMETTILNILLFLIIAVAGFGILATFFMIVVEKTRDIGILKSLGASRSGVMSIFLSYGFSLGVVGAGVGTVSGLLFVANINKIAELLESITGREVFDPTIYYFQEIPTIVNPFTVVWISVGAMLIAVTASVLPALRAARMHPVEALRYE